MNTKPNGGPAFPLSLREYYASKFFKTHAGMAPAWSSYTLARLAYEYADAMLAEREK